MLLAGRYEGVDERLLAREVDEEIAIGDFVVSGGELPALMLIDAIVRQLPGVLNDAASARRSRSWRAARLPALHAARGVRGRGGAGRAAVGESRADPALAAQGALARTMERRPDLLEGRALSKEESKLLAEIRSEKSGRQLTVAVPNQINRAHQGAPCAARKQGGLDPSLKNRNGKGLRDEHHRNAGARGNRAA